MSRWSGWRGSSEIVDPRRTSDDCDEAPVAPRVDLIGAIGFTALGGVAASAAGTEGSIGALLVGVPAGLIAGLYGLSAWYGFRNGRCCRLAHAAYRAAHPPRLLPALDYDSEQCRNARRRLEAEGDPPKRFELYRRMPEGCHRPPAAAPEQRTAPTSAAPAADPAPPAGPPAPPAEGPMIGPAPPPEEAPPPDAGQ